MLSKSGKIEWLCPNCKSKNINYLPFFPISFYHNKSVLSYIKQTTGLCSDCCTSWPWSSRIKVSLKNRKVIQKCFQMTLLNKLKNYISKNQLFVK